MSVKLNLASSKYLDDHTMTNNGSVHEALRLFDKLDRQEACSPQVMVLSCSSCLLGTYREICWSQAVACTMLLP